MQPSASDEEPSVTTRRAMLTGTIAAAGGVMLPLSVTEADAEPIKDQGTDPELRALLREVDRRRIETTVRGLVSLGTRHTPSSQTDPLRGIGAARDWIFAELSRHAAQSGGRMTVDLQSYVQQPIPRIPVPTTITNVVATLRGTTSPERVHVITGHYDSRVTDVLNFTDDAPGADDDASGVAVIMEIARTLATRPTAATVVLAAVAAEEQGLFGSNFMASQYKAAGTDVQAMFSNDIVGSSTAEDGSRDPRTIRLFAEGVPTAETPAEANIRRSVGGENDSPSRQLARLVSDVADRSGAGLNVRVIYRRDRYLRGSDHISFLQQGYPAARFTEPAEDFAHQHQDVKVVDGKQFGDLPEFWDFDYITRVARLNLATLWSLAQAPGTPKNVRILTAQLTNDTDLAWNRGPEPDLAGYEVVWRETTEPEWTHVIRVGDVTTAHVKLSKDNVFFGVRAVNRAAPCFPSPRHQLKSPRSRAQVDGFGNDDSPAWPPQWSQPCLLSSMRWGPGTVRLLTSTSEPGAQEGPPCACGCNHGTPSSSNCSPTLA